MLFSVAMLYQQFFFSVAGTCSRVWTSIHCSPIVRYAIKRGKLRTAEVTWTMGGKLLRLLLLLCAAVALLCSLASAEQGRMTTEYSCSLKLRVCHLWCVDCVCVCVCVRACYLCILERTGFIVFLLIETTAGCQSSGLPITERLGGMSLIHPYPV